MFRPVMLSVVAVVAALGTSASPVLAANQMDGAAPAGAASAASPDTVSAVTDRLARQLAAPLAGAAARAGVFAAAADAAVDLSQFDAGPAFAQAVQQANSAVLTAKGLPAATGSLLQLRLAHPDMKAALARGETPLVAAAPADDAVTAVTAYDRTGAPVRLDATTVPQRPVFVVEVDTDKALPAGLAVFRAILDAHGVTGAKSEAATTAGYWATQVRAVRLSDDKEPWIKGAAEIFGLTGGFGLDGHVKVDTVTMPYLDYDGTTYYPNQLIVHFSAYKYNLADFVMMEDDGDTNYQALAIAIANALLTIVDGGAYIPLVNAILNAIPGSWWTDDPDYVDSWYTLSTASSGHFVGAAANGWMDLQPYWVQQF
jgi:hypothetical protein